MDAYLYMIGSYNPDTLGGLPIPKTGPCIQQACAETAIACAKSFRKDYCGNSGAWPRLITLLAGFGAYSTWKITVLPDSELEAHLYVPPN